MLLENNKKADGANETKELSRYIRRILYKVFQYYFEFWEFIWVSIVSICAFIIAKVFSSYINRIDVELKYMNPIYTWICLKLVCTLFL